jgi:hypothetical protein
MIMFFRTMVFIVEKRLYQRTSYKDMQGESGACKVKPELQIDVPALEAYMGH